MTESRPRRRSTVRIVLPAFNEAGNIAGLINSIAHAMEDEWFSYCIVVVDDGSTDETFQVADSFRQTLPLSILRHQSNQGLGATLRDGLIYTLKSLEDDDIVITMDADATHSPGLILQMTRKIREGHDLVIASRFRPGSRTYGVPIIRRFLSVAACVALRLAFPFSGVRDFTCGFRAYRGGALKMVAGHYGDKLVDTEGFQCMVDILLKFHRLDMIIGEVPMVLRYDLKSGASKMRVWSTAWGTLGQLIKHRRGH